MAEEQEEPPELSQEMKMEMILATFGTRLTEMITPSDADMNEGKIMINTFIQARRSSLNLTFGADEVLLLAGMYHKILATKAPRTSQEDLNVLTALESRAFTARKQNVGIELDNVEVEVTTFCFSRTLLYSRGTVSFAALDTWLSAYSDPPVNNCHRLDYRRDLSDGYSLRLEQNQDDILAKLRGMTGEEIEDYAEIIFFSAVALVERLIEAKACGKGMDINARESLALMMVKIIENGESLQASERLKNHKVIQVTKSGKMASLEPREVVELLKTYKNLPRPKPKSTRAESNFVQSINQSIIGNMTSENSLRDLQNKFTDATTCVKLSIIEATSLSLLFAASADIEKLATKHMGDPLHPLTTGHKKLKATFTNRCGCHQVTIFDSEEVAYFRNLVQDLQPVPQKDGEPEASAQTGRVSRRGTKISGSPSIQPKDRLETPGSLPSVADYSKMGFRAIASRIAAWNTDTSFAAPMVSPPAREPMLAIIEKLKQMSSETIQISRIEKETILSAIQSLPFVLSYSAYQNDTMRKYDRVNELYSFRCRDLSGYGTNETVVLYGKALGKAGLGDYSKEMALLVASTEGFQFYVNYLTAKNELLLMKNLYQNMMLGSIFYQDKPQSLQQRVENALELLSSKNVEAELGEQKEKAVKLSKVHEEANAKKRALDNKNAQELFLALAKKVSETSGPEVLKSMVWDTCGLAVAGIAPCGQTEEGVPSMEFTTGPESCPPEFAPNSIANLQGCGYDFVVEESPVSEMLAAQLQLPSKATLPELDLQGDKVPWRCCPVSEIELWKSEKLQASKAYQDLLATLTVEQQVRLNVEDTDTPSQNTAEQSAKIDFLVSYIQSTHKHITDFLISYQEKYRKTGLAEIHDCFKTWGPETSESFEAFPLILASIDTLAGEHRKLMNDFENQKCFGDLFQLNIPRYLDLPVEPLKFSVLNAQSLLFQLMEEIKGTAKAREGMLRETSSLHKSIVAKDKKLDEKEAELIRQRDFRSAREEKISKENLEMESKLSATQQKLEKALKEPDRVKEEFYQKIQKLYAKINYWESKWKSDNESHNILRLDNEASLKDLEDCRAKIVKYKSAIERHTREYAKLKKAKDELLALQPAQASELELQANRKAIREAQFREKDWLEEKNKLEDERSVDEKTIRELSQSRERQKEKLAEMEETQSQVLEELEKERAESKKLKETQSQVLEELEKERAELKKVKNVLAAAGLTFTHSQPTLP